MIIIFYNLIKLNKTNTTNINPFLNKNINEKVRYFTKNICYTETQNLPKTRGVYIMYLDFTKV